MFSWFLFVFTWNDARTLWHTQCYIMHYLSIYNLRRSRGELSCAFSQRYHMQCPSACQNRQPTGSFKKLTLPLFQSTANNTSSKIHYLIPPSNKSPYNLRQKQEYQQPSTETKRVADSFIYKCIIKQFNEFLYFFIPGIN